MSWSEPLTLASTFLNAESNKTHPRFSSIWLKLITFIMSCNDKCRRTRFCCSLETWAECLNLPNCKTQIMGKVDLLQIFCFLNNFIFCPFQILDKNVFYRLSTWFSRKFHLAVKDCILSAEVSLCAPILINASVIGVMFILNVLVLSFVSLLLFWKCPGLILRLCKKSTSLGKTYCERSSRAFFLPQLSPWPLWDCTTLL